MSFTHNYCIRLLGHIYTAWAPGPKYWGSSSPLNPMKSAPMQLLCSEFKQSNNVNICFILFTLYYIIFLFYLYFIILFMLTSLEGTCAKPKFRLGNWGKGKGRGKGTGGSCPLPHLWSLLWSRYMKMERPQPFDRKWDTLDVTHHSRFVIYNATVVIWNKVQTGREHDGRELI